MAKESTFITLSEEEGGKRCQPLELSKGADTARLDVKGPCAPVNRVNGGTGLAILNPTVKMGLSG